MRVGGASWVGFPPRRVRPASLRRRVVADAGDALLGGGIMAGALGAVILVRADHRSIGDLVAGTTIVEARR
jgi:uncharacterized RDD family membrane protein YckC